MKPAVYSDNMAARSLALYEVDDLTDELGVTPQSNLIGIFQQVQGRFGYLPREILAAISVRTNVRP